MGIIDGLFAGRAGIESHGTAISVLADNISNTNTVGFKASRADFSDLVASSISGGTAGAGSGSQVAAITQIFNQGSFEFTGRGLDLAIDGNGFFIVSDNGQQLYTRAGNFRVDAAGNLLDQNGNNVMGFPTGGSGSLQNLNVNNISNSSVSTQEANIAGNLDASATTSSSPTPNLLSATNPTGTTTSSQLNDASTFSTFLNVFDSLGGTHTLNISFMKTATANTWNVYGTVNSGEVTGGVGSQPFQVFSIAGLHFNNDGSIDSSTVSPIATAAAPWNNGSAAGSFSVDFTNFTQFAAASAINAVDQDGSGGGNVISFGVDTNGTLSALLNNGQTSEIGVIALAKFSNPEGLTRKGGSTYAQTSTSGAPVVGAPGTGQFGGISAGALELSTADLADDFVKLIQLQRGFQGSSRVIGRINDLLNEIIQLA